MELLFMRLNHFFNKMEKRWKYSKISQIPQHVPINVDEHIQKQKK